jgi:predicted glycoside hydrolase/deacetylase ChbG (UPF0249 family)
MKSPQRSVKGGLKTPPVAAFSGRPNQTTAWEGRPTDAEPCSPSVFEHSLILHADDFGFNAAVTHGIVEAFSDGLLTSTSLLTNAPAAELAVAEWRRLEDSRRSGKLPSAVLRRRLGDRGSPFDLGVHLNLTQGRPLSGVRFPSELLDAAGRFLSPGRLFAKLLAGGQCWRPAIAAELAAQIEWLIDRDLRPSHLNGHQYVEMMPVASQVVIELAKRFSVSFVRAACEPGQWRTSLRPGFRLANWGLSFVKGHYAARWRRRLDACGIRHADAFFGASHAGLIDLQVVRRFLHIARGYAVTEIAWHPGDVRNDPAGDEQADGWNDPLAPARPSELRLLCFRELADLIGSHRLRLGRLAEPASCQSRAA